jgi:hypothetical protein
LVIKTPVVAPLIEPTLRSTGRGQSGSDQAAWHKYPARPSGHGSRSFLIDFNSFVFHDYLFGYDDNVCARRDLWLGDGDPNTGPGFIAP